EGPGGGLDLRGGGPDRLLGRSVDGAVHRGRVVLDGLGELLGRRTGVGPVGGAALGEQPVRDQDGGVDALADQRHHGEGAGEVADDQAQVHLGAGLGGGAEDLGGGVDRRLGGGGEVEPAERTLGQRADQV